jgi:hypothetical protein
MNQLLNMHFKRRETEYTGGDDLDGRYMPAQRVSIGNCIDEDEDIWTVVDANGKTHQVDGCELHPHPESELTNVEFMTLMMDKSRTAMTQVMVLQAVEQFAKAVVEKSADELDSPMISGALWRDTALEVLGWFAARDAVKQDRRERAPAG